MPLADAKVVHAVAAAPQYSVPPCGEKVDVTPVPPAVVVILDGAVPVAEPNRLIANPPEGTNTPRDAV